MVERGLIGNNVLEADGDFADGYANGTLYYYDNQLPVTTSLYEQSHLRIHDGESL